MYALKQEKHYTYDDYAKWDDEIRRELIDGVIYMMSPAPSQMHQQVSMELSRQFSTYLKGKQCKVFHAPFDVRLNADAGDDTVCQPDLVIVCDTSKLDGKGCKGVPEMLVEILSPSSVSYDKVVKFNRYLQAGVKEYWIVDPDSKTVQVYILENGRYIASAYGEEDAAPVNVLTGCVIELKDVFAL